MWMTLFNSILYSIEREEFNFPLNLLSLHFSLRFRFELKLTHFFCFFRKINTQRSLYIGTLKFPYSKIYVNETMTECFNVQQKK